MAAIARGAQPATGTSHQGSRDLAPAAIPEWTNLVLRCGWTWRPGRTSITAAFDRRSLANVACDGPKLRGDAMTDQTTLRASRTFLDRYFGLTNTAPTCRTEFIAGLTTFLTMVYIVFVNPTILGNAGMDKGAVFVATCIAAAVSTLVMALYANYPIALAPGMGLNAFFAFTVVLTYKYSWQQALAAVFCPACLFLVLSVFRHPRIRHQRHSAEPEARDLRRRRAFPRHHRARAGEDRGRHPATLVTLGDLKQWPAAAVLARLRADRGAQLSQDSRRHAHRHAHRLASSASARSRVGYRSLASSIARPILPGARGRLSQRHRCLFRECRRRRAADRVAAAQRLCARFRSAG